MSREKKMATLFPPPSDDINISQLRWFRDRINTCIDQYIKNQEIDEKSDPNLQIGLNLILEHFEKVNAHYFPNCETDSDDDDYQIDLAKIQEECAQRSRIISKMREFRK